MTRLILALYGIAAVLSALYPVIAEAKIGANHNETLVRDRR
jgi:hypothetical protein